MSFEHFQSSVTFFLNGKKIVESDLQPEVTVLSYVRSKGLTGSKLGCGEVRQKAHCCPQSHHQLTDQGGCGACTVVVSKFDAKTRRVLHTAVNGCLAPLASVDGCSGAWQRYRPENKQ